MQRVSKLGIGIDIIYVRRFEEIPYEKNKEFYKKIFNASEMKYCLKFKNPYVHFAAKFAVKEAVKKSLVEKVSLLEILTSHSDSKPHVNIKKKNNYIFLVSLSHEKEVAVAVVISQKLK